jgi:hypothetical protein
MTPKEDAGEEHNRKNIQGKKKRSPLPPKHEKCETRPGADCRDHDPYSGPEKPHPGWVEQARAYCGRDADEALVVRQAWGSQLGELAEKLSSGDYSDRAADSVAEQFLIFLDDHPSNRAFYQEICRAIAAGEVDWLSLSKCLSAMMQHFRTKSIKDPGAYFRAIVQSERPGWVKPGRHASSANTRSIDQ